MEMEILILNLRHIFNSNSTYKLSLLSIGKMFYYYTTNL